MARCVCSTPNCPCAPERNYKAVNFCPRPAMVLMFSPIYSFVHPMCLPCAEHALAHRGYREATETEIASRGGP